MGVSELNTKNRAEISIWNSFFLVVGSFLGRPRIGGIGLLSLRRDFLEDMSGDVNRPEEEIHDILVFNARVLTCDESTDVATSIACKDGVVSWIGRSGDPLPVSRFRVDARGSSVLPGFNDAHAHYEPASFVPEWPRLAPGSSPADLRSLVSSEAESCAGSRWLVILDIGNEASVGLDDRTTVDSLVPPRQPMLLISTGGGRGWANTAALRVSRLLTKQPLLCESGAWRNASDGLPGPRVEGIALQAVLSAVADPSTAGMRAMSRNGLTSVQLMGHHCDKISILVGLDGQGRVPLRVAAAVDKASFVARLHEKLPSGDIDDCAGRVRAIGLKLYADHLVDGGTAWRLPYAPKESSKVEWGQHTLTYGRDPVGEGGVVPPDVKAKHAFYSVEELSRWFERAEAENMQVFVHATGDGAVRGVLDAVEMATTRRLEASGTRPSTPLSDRRHRVEHVELCHEIDFPRFARLGVLPSMSPIHAPALGLGEDTGWLAHVHPELFHRSFAWQSIRRHGVPFPFSTDFPIFPMNPMRTLRAAISRHPWPGNDHQEDHRFTLRDAIRCYTVDSSFAERKEHVKGALRVGMLADFVLLSTDILAEGAQERLEDVTPMMTVCGGRLSFLHSDFCLIDIAAPVVPVPPAQPALPLARAPRAVYGITVRAATTPQEIRHICLVMAKLELSNPGLNDWRLFPIVDPSGWFIGETKGKTVASVGAVRWTPTFGYLGHDFCDRMHKSAGFIAAVWNAGKSHLIATTDQREPLLAVDSSPEEEPEFELLGFRLAFHSTRFVGCLPVRAGTLAGSRLREGMRIASLAAVDPRNICSVFDECTGVDRPDFVMSWIQQVPGAAYGAVDDSGRLIGFGSIRPSAGGFRVGPLFVLPRLVPPNLTATRVAATILEALAPHAVSPSVMLAATAAREVVVHTMPIAIDVPESNVDAVSMVERAGMGRIARVARMLTGPPLTNVHSSSVFGLTSWEVGP